MSYKIILGNGIHLLVNAAKNNKGYRKVRWFNYSAWGQVYLKLRILLWRTGVPCALEGTQNSILISLTDLNHFSWALFSTEHGTFFVKKCIDSFRLELLLAMGEVFHKELMETFPIFMGKRKVSLTSKLKKWICEQSKKRLYLLLFNSLIQILLRTMVFQLRNVHLIARFQWSSPLKIIRIKPKCGQKSLTDPTSSLLKLTLLPDLF